MCGLAGHWAPGTRHSELESLADRIAGQHKYVVQQ